MKPSQVNVMYFGDPSLRERILPEIAGDRVNVLFEASHNGPSVQAKVWEILAKHAVHVIFIDHTFLNGQGLDFARLIPRDAVDKVYIGFRFYMGGYGVNAGYSSVDGITRFGFRMKLLQNMVPELFLEGHKSKPKTA